MRALPPAAAVLPLAAALALSSLGACGGDSGGVCECRLGEVCQRGRCFPAEPEPAATRATCGPIAQAPGAAIATPEPAAGSCPTAVQTSAAPVEFPIQRLENQVVGTTVSFTVPAGAQSFTIIEQALSAPSQVRLGGTLRGNIAAPLVVRAPDGAVWYDDSRFAPTDGSSDLVFYATDAPAVGTLTVPNTTRALEIARAGGLPAGTWTATVSDLAFLCTQPAPQIATLCGRTVVPPAEFDTYSTGVYDVTIVVKPGAPSAPGRMDVALYLHRCPGAEYDGIGQCCRRQPTGTNTVDPVTGRCTQLETPLTAATAPTDPDAQRMLGTFAAIMAKANVCLGTVTWYDLPEWAQARWAGGVDLDAAACDVGLGQLFTLSQPGNHMNLFLVPDILAQVQDGSVASVVGIDGTIPGPVSLSGTIKSGAAVSAANLRARPTQCVGELALGCGADTTAYIAAHETGHYLGLYHTTEQGGDAFDPLSDTPHCECTACVGAPDRRARCGGAIEIGTVGNECLQSTATCGGGANLMFWVLTVRSSANVSPQQSEVMRSSPLVR